MAEILRYTRGDELEPVSITWYQPNGTLYNFSTGWTFRARIGTGSGFLVEKTTGFTGAATAPNLSLNFTTGELDGVASGTYHIDIQATLTATVQTITRTWLFQVLAGVGTDTLPADELGIPELAAADPTEVDLDTVGGVTTLTLLETIARRSSIHTPSQLFFNVYGTSSNQTIVLDQLCLYPTLLSPTTSPATLNRIGIHVVTPQASAVGRLGIYTDNGGLPGNLIAEASSTADLSTGGTKALTISASIPKPGLYWLAFVAQVTAGVVIRGGASAYWPVSIPLGTSDPADDDLFRACRTQAGITGALPATLTISGSPNQARARIFFRFA